MVKSPFQIILELLTGLIKEGVQTFSFVFQKLGELLISLAFIANTGIVGLVLSSVIGGVAVYFLGKFLFKNSKTLMTVLLVYVFFVLMMILALSFSTPTPQTPPV